MKQLTAAYPDSPFDTSLLIAALLVAGSLIGLVMVFNSQLSGDQYHMLNLGWQLSHNHVWTPYGMATSGGGYSPGGLTSLLVGLQLSIWNDYRSPALFTLAFNLAAVILLAQLTWSALSATGRLLLIWLVWMAPWHLYFSAHIWDPNYMFVFAVLHLATAQRIAQRNEAWCSALHVLLLILGLQIHTSAAMLCILSMLLVATKRLPIHWGGAAVGAMLGLVTLYPWLLAIQQDASLVPGGKGFLGRGLVYVYPMLRGVLYWLQVSSLSVAHRMTELDFTSAFGARANTWLAPFSKLLISLAHLSLPFCCWLQWRFFRKLRHKLKSRPDINQQPRQWLRQYVMWMLIAAVLSFALSPSTIMFWQVLVALPASALVVVMSFETLLRSKARIWARRIAYSFCTAGLMLLLMQSIAAPMYRCGGYELSAPRDLLTDTHAPINCIRPN